MEGLEAHRPAPVDRIKNPLRRGGRIEGVQKGGKVISSRRVQKTATWFIGKNRGKKKMYKKHPRRGEQKEEVRGGGRSEKGRGKSIGTKN